MARTATSQNGWPVYTSSSGLVNLSWVTGRCRADNWIIFNYLCERFNREVEEIRLKESWGYAYRPIRGKSSGFSNHASATAIDLNAPAHPLGARKTFSPAQVVAIRRILNDLMGVVRWGGDYSLRKDEMHFEINVGPGDPRFNKLVQKLLAPPKPVAPPPVIGGGPNPARPFSLGNVVYAATKARGSEYRGNVTTVQQYLNDNYLKHGQGRVTVDGYWGTTMDRVYAGWQHYFLGLSGPLVIGGDTDGIPGKASLGALLAPDYYIVD